MPMASPPAPAKSSTLRIEKPPYPRAQSGRIPELAFPDGQHLPPPARERPLVPLIAHLVSLKLRYPEVQSGFREPRERASRVPVPEAAMHENNLPSQPEDEIRTARQIPVVKPVAIAERVDKIADPQFRARVLGAHARHDFGAFLGRERVHHKVLRPLPGHEQRPLVRDILLRRLADDPGQRDFFLARHVFKRLVEFSRKADGRAHGRALGRHRFFFSFRASGHLARPLAGEYSTTIHHSGEVCGKQPFNTSRPAPLPASLPPPPPQISPRRRHCASSFS